MSPLAVSSPVTTRFCFWPEQAADRFDWC